jgi:SAM-dependent methyltransferase
MESFETSRAGRVGRDHLKEGLVSLFLKQALAEFRVSWRGRARFRRSENAAAVRAYCAMTPAEFEDVNARQKWSNWRTIPRNLLGRLPEGPCRAIDLCSGVGHATQVLAYYLPPGSRILGLEYNPEFVVAAGRRSYRHASGEPARVAFGAQSVLEPFRDAAGAPLPDRCVDLVNSCGALGIHFGAEQIDRLTGEVWRVLKVGGLAAVDSGTEGVDEEQMTALFESRGFQPLSRAKSCFLDRFTQLCFRKPRGESPPA